MSGSASTPSSYFEQMYESAPDPWGVATRWYEQRKYALTMAALPRPRYRRGFEPGCGIGVLTTQLAQRCDALVATDIVEAALDRARARLADRLHVCLDYLPVPTGWPDGTFDLVLLGEIGYYFSQNDLELLIERCVRGLDPGGHLVAVHWRHPVAEYPLRGDEVHGALARASGLAHLVGHVEEDFRLDVWTRGTASSVATAEGLVE